MPESKVMAHGLSSMTSWTMNALTDLKAKMAAQVPQCVVRTVGLINQDVMVSAVFSDVGEFYELMLDRRQRKDYSAYFQGMSAFRLI